MHCRQRRCQRRVESVPHDIRIGVIKLALEVILLSWKAGEGLCWQYMKNLRENGSDDFKYRGASNAIYFATRKTEKTAVLRMNGGGVNYVRNVVSNR